MRRAVLAVLLAGVAGMASRGGTPAAGAREVVQGRLTGRVVRTTSWTRPGRVLATGSGRVFISDRTGEVLWQHKGGNVHDAWMLPSGNVLFADGEVTEVSPVDGKVVFRYRPKETTGGGAYACQRLPGRTVR